MWKDTHIINNAYSFYVFTGRPLTCINEKSLGFLFFCDDPLFLPAFSLMYLFPVPKEGDGIVRERMLWFDVFVHIMAKHDTAFEYLPKLLVQLSH